LAAALGCYFLLGVLLPLATAPLGAWLSAHVPRDRQGRVFSTFFDALVLAAAPLGAGLTGLAAGALPIPVLFALTGLAVVAATALARTRGT